MPRRRFDFYETPPHYVQALLKHSPELLTETVIEPCVGQHAIANLLPHTVTGDIDRKRRADVHGDATKCATWDALIRKALLQRRSINIATNPPFNVALQILEQALTLDVPVHLLLRLSFLEPTKKRRDTLEDFPPTRLIVLPRYSFRKNDKGKRATDSVTCAWASWNVIHKGIFIDGTKPA